MNALVLTCLLCFVVCSRGAAQNPEDTYSSALAVVTGGPASGEGLPSSASDDDEELNEELSGRDTNNFSLHKFQPNNNEQKKKKGKGRKNKPKAKNTTPLNPDRTSITSGFTSSTSSTSSTTQNPCTSTHLTYCIHGYCKYIEGLHEPVCICMTGYQGTRCGIRTLGTANKQNSSTELVQTVLVIIAVVLSVISCIAILLMTCAHYRSHKNFLASYLGSGSEQEKLQKATRDVVV